MPKVSVVIPVFNVEKFIERCARSLFEQTLDDIEYIFVDDCTPDNSVAVLKEVLQDYPDRKSQTKILHHEVNRGLPIARHTGVKEASGDYIIHCDSDDWVDVNMYKTMWEIAVGKGAEIVVCDFVRHDGCVAINECCGYKDDDKMQYIRELILQNESWAVWNKLVKRELYQNLKYFPEKAMGEDMVLILQLVFNANSFCVCHRPFYYYFYNPSSIVKTKTRKAMLEKNDQYYSNYKLVKRFFDENCQLKTIQNELCWIRYSIKSMLLFVEKSNALYDNDDGFRFVELDVLFCSGIKLKRKIDVIKKMIKRFFFSSKSFLPK